MNNYLFKRFLLAALISFVTLNSGCFKNALPIYYYTLDNREGKMQHTTVGDLPVILIGPVRIASILDQGQLVTQTTLHSITLAEQHRWAGNLSEMVSSTLISRLRQQLNTEAVFSFPDTNGKEGLTIAIDLLHFEKNMNKEAVIEARYHILSSKDSVTLHTATFHRSAPLPDNSYDSLVQGLNTGLSDLSNEIARQILLLSPSTDRS